MNDQTSEKSTIKRREFITLGAGLGMAGLTLAVSGLGVYLYMDPVVTYGTPKKMKIPSTAIPDIGQELLFPDQKVLLRRDAEGQLAAISLVCTHLGCTVNRVSTGFQCPCHGSQYDTDGIVVGGPAPTTLAWHSIRLLPGKQLEIDTGVTLGENTWFKV